MSEKKIKVSAPRENPHICYIPENRKEAISKIKEKLEKSLYRVLCIVAHTELNTKSSIYNFKIKVRKQGFKDIGEWATALVDFLYENITDIKHMDLTTVKITKEIK